MHKDFLLKNKGVNNKEVENILDVLIVANNFGKIISVRGGARM